MILGFSTKDKWFYEKKSCFEYVNIYKDMTDGDYIFVLDSDLDEFRKDYCNELKDDLIIKIKECEVELV